MKRLKLIIWLAGVVLLSGWISFAILYINYTKKVALLQTRIEQLDSQVKAVGRVAENLNQTIAEIDRMISEFEKLKENLKQVKEKIEKASKTD
ncbi:MAG: hypothetical protein NC906_02205 [Candidatus Omnitrophica bacterium]|nr:hypothetical protein [Candidatus Omnitrophota bacterium]MCM8816141.1 hypothetical protein [Candidatus Omnitrophota bacterium]